MELQCGHGAISHLLVELMNHLAKPPARDRGALAPSAPSTGQRTRSTGFSAALAHKLSSKGTLFLSHTGGSEASVGSAPSLRCPFPFRFSLVRRKSAGQSSRAWIPLLASAKKLPGSHPAPRSPGVTVQLGNPDSKDRLASRAMRVRKH